MGSNTHPKKPGKPANKESQAEKQVQNASKEPQPQQQGQNASKVAQEQRKKPRKESQAKKQTLQAPLKTRHERVPGGVGAYASDTGLAFIRLPGMKRGYWYKPGDCVGAPSNNQVMEALYGPPTTQPSQVSPSRVTRNSVAAAPIQPFFPPRQSAAAPTISSLAKTITKPIPKSLGLKKSKAMDWLKDQTMEF